MPSLIGGDTLTQGKTHINLCALFHACMYCVSDQSELRSCKAPQRAQMVDSIERPSFLDQHKAKVKGNKRARFTWDSRGGTVWERIFQYPAVGHWVIGLLVVQWFWYRQLWNTILFSLLMWSMHVHSTFPWPSYYNLDGRIRLSICVWIVWSTSAFIMWQMGDFCIQCTSRVIGN